MSGRPEFVPGEIPALRFRFTTPQTLSFTHNQLLKLAVKNDRPARGDPLPPRVR